MLDIPYNDLDYCMYGMEYRKRARIWNNLVGWVPKQLCKKDCGNVINNKHKQTAQRMPNGKKDTWGDKKLYKQNELYIIPEMLVIELFEFIINNI